MNTYYLTKEEDIALHESIMLRKYRPLYEYFLELPMEELKAYPEKGYRNWMGRAAKTPRALELRDYILFWRIAAQGIRERYSRAYLETLSDDTLESFLDVLLRQIPLWAFDDPIADIIKILCRREKM